MSTTTQTRRCAGTNKAGEPCQAYPAKGGSFCLVHDENLREQVGFGGAQPNSGPKPRPKVTALIRDRLEEHADEVAQVYLEAMKAVRPDGEPDYAIRLKAISDWQDRAHGKPHQSTSVTGADGGPVSIAQVWGGALDGASSLN